MKFKMKFKINDTVRIEVPWQHSYLGAIYEVRPLHKGALPYTVRKLMSDPRYIGPVTGGMLTDYAANELAMYCPSEET